MRTVACNEEESVISVRSVCDFKNNEECLLFSHGSHGSHGFRLLRSFPVRLSENRCLQRKRSVRSVWEDQEGSGQDEQVSVQGDDLTMLNGE